MRACVHAGVSAVQRVIPPAIRLEQFFQHILLHLKKLEGGLGITLAKHQRNPRVDHRCGRGSEEVF